MRDDLARGDGVRLLLERVGDLAARQVGDLEVYFVDSGRPNSCTAMYFGSLAEAARHGDAGLGDVRQHHVLAVPGGLLPALTARLA